MHSSPLVCNCVCTIGCLPYVPYNPLIPLPYDPLPRLAFLPCGTPCVCSDFHAGLTDFTVTAVDQLADEEVREDKFTRFQMGGMLIEEEAGVSFLVTNAVGVQMQFLSALPQLHMQAVEWLKVKLRRGERGG